MPARRPEGAHLRAGQEALARGEWRAAREAFAAALEERETASALEGLSESLWWLDEVAESLRLRERAFTVWSAKGELCRAARAAVWLAREHQDAQDDVAAARQWLERAERLAASAAACGEGGWVEAVRARQATDATTVAAHAERAEALARAGGDRDLELVALSERGRACVTRGRLDEGMALLDQAAAAATGGEMSSIAAIGDVCWNMIQACDRALDLERAAQWCRAVDEFARRHHHVPLFATCQAVYGGLLLATGRWAAAESALTRAARTVEKGHPPLRALPLGRLALLRLRQDRVEEAAELLAGLETHPDAAPAAAALHLARGEAQRAADALDSRLQAAGDDAMVAAPLLDALVEARLAAGDLAAARAACTRLVALSGETKQAAIEASALLAAAAVADEGSAAPIDGVRRAVEIYATLGLPFDEARARLRLARGLRLVEPDAAAREALSAREAFERLGAPRWAAAAANIDTPDAGPRPPKAAAPRRKRR